MNKETLIAMGLTEEQARKVMEGLDGNYVPKTRFNEVNTELNAAKATVKERDKQLETLKAATGDADALRAQITELQTANAEEKKAHEAEMRQVRIDNAVELALTGARARNNAAAKALLADFLSRAELDGDGSVKGLDAEIRKLAGDKSTAFLFDTESGAGGQKFRGVKPSESGDAPPAGMTLEKFRALSPADRFKFSNEHPEEYKAMYENGGN